MQLGVNRPPAFVRDAPSSESACSWPIETAGARNRRRTRSGGRSYPKNCQLATANATCLGPGQIDPYRKFGADGQLVYGHKWVMTCSQLVHPIGSQEARF